MGKRLLPCIIDFRFIVFLNLRVLIYTIIIFKVYVYLLHNIKDIMHEICMHMYI
jgi:hypothetical protein